MGARLIFPASKSIVAPRAIHTSTPGICALCFLSDLFDPVIPDDEIMKSVEELRGKESYFVLKKTKKKEQEVDIRPQIVSLSYSEHVLTMILRAGGDQNIKAETVANVLFDLMGIDYHREKITIMRLELFAEDLVPLEDFETIGK